MRTNLERRGALAAAALVLLACGATTTKPDAGTDAGTPVEDAGVDAGTPGPCDVNNGGCDLGAICTPAGATRTCACPTGSTGDGLTCTPELSMLSVTPGGLTPRFAATTTSYVASIPSSESLVTVNAATVMPGATVLIDGQAVSTRMIPLAMGTRPVVVTVRHELSMKSRQYNVLLVKARRTVQQAYLKASNAEAQDGFGGSVAMSNDGSTLVVAAPAEDGVGNGLNDSGAVYVFRRIAGTWSEETVLRASNADADDGFGTSIALSNDASVLVVGAPREDSDGSSPMNNGRANSGAAYVFRFANLAWTEEAVLKPDLVDVGDAFGSAVTVSGDGATIVVGAPDEDSSSAADPANGDAPSSGAAYVFTKPAAAWAQAAYLKASNIGAADRFGGRVEADDSASVLAIGATGEASAAKGINGDQADNTAASAGAVYVLRKSGSTWAQEAYVKASNAGTQALFGATLALSGDGSVLAVGAWGEKSNATGIDGDQSNTSADRAGAVYLFQHGMSGWAQGTYVKASNAETDDLFGFSLGLSRDGTVLLVGARLEDSPATGIDGPQSGDSVISAGAAYLFRQTTAGWVQEAYVKASNTGTGDELGAALALSGDGSSFACAAPKESSNATGINGDQTNDAAMNAGAVYAFVRQP